MIPGLALVRFGSAHIPRAVALSPIEGGALLSGFGHRLVAVRGYRAGFGLTGIGSGQMRLRPYPASCRAMAASAASTLAA